VKLTKDVKARTLVFFGLIILIVILVRTYTFTQRLKNVSQTTEAVLGEIQLPSPTLAPTLTPIPTPTVTPTPKPKLTPTPKATPTQTPSQSSNPTPTQSTSQSSNQNPTPTPTTAPQASGNMTDVYITYYGWVDNDPPGPAIAYPKSENSASLHQSAGGTGSFEDPITFASDRGAFPVGTKIYVPYIQKYVIMEDMCASCSGNHIDIWMESDGSFPSQLLACEDYWTKSKIQVEINPPNNRSVDSSPLFNKATGECRH
jgi:3D (Asp-Asp-Asp) domain-containing protein